MLNTQDSKKGNNKIKVEKERNNYVYWRRENNGMAAVAAETVDQMIAVAAVVFKSIKDKKKLNLKLYLNTNGQCS